jgi:hypothetical protein
MIEAIDDPRGRVARPRTCRWCLNLVPETARADALFCGKRCRQASHRAGVRRAELEATDRPLRLAYADPPYLGLARRYYGREASFAGEVDHSELVSRLATYDGWALSCSSRSVPAIGALLVAADVEARLAVWTRRPAPHAHARLITAWEGVFYSPARRVLPGRVRQVVDVLTGVEGRPRPTLPGSVIGMKPPAFCVWLFGLLGAMPGDRLDDLFPGSGIVGRTWASWAAVDDASVAGTHDTFARGLRDASGDPDDDASRPSTNRRIASGSRRHESPRTSDDGSRLTAVGRDG